MGKNASIRSTLIAKMTKFEIVWTKVWTLVLITLLTWHRHLILLIGRSVDGHCLVVVAQLELWFWAKDPTKKMSLRPGIKLIFEIFLFSNHHDFLVLGLSALKIRTKRPLELWVQILNRRSASQGFLVAFKWKLAQGVTKKTLKNVSKIAIFSIFAD